MRTRAKWYQVEFYSEITTRQIYKTIKKLKLSKHVDGNISLYNCFQNLIFCRTSYVLNHNAKFFLFLFYLLEMTNLISYLTMFGTACTYHVFNICFVCLLIDHRGVGSYINLGGQIIMWGHNWLR